MSNNKSQIAALGVLLVASGLYLWMRRKAGKQSSTPSLLDNTNIDMSSYSTLPRGYRNNNPLNIRYSAANNWQGKALPNTDKNNTFEQFITMPYGYRAALKLLQNYINKYGCNTIAKIIQKWAPPTENNTQNYITNVCNLIKTNFGRTVSADTEVLAANGELLRQMVYAMSIIENGNTAATREAGLPSMEAIQNGWNLL